MPCGRDLQLFLTTLTLLDSLFFLCLYLHAHFIPHTFVRPHILKGEVTEAQRKVSEAGSRNEAERLTMSAAAEEAVRLYNAKQAEVAGLKDQMRQAAEKV